MSQNAPKRCLQGKDMLRSAVIKDERCLLKVRGLKCRRLCICKDDSWKAEDRWDLWDECESGSDGGEMNVGEVRNTKIYCVEQ